MARRDLPSKTGLSAGTITQVTGELLRRGFIAERKDESRRSGRPRVYLEIRKEGAIVLGALLTERGAICATFVDLAGNILFSIELEPPVDTNSANTFEALADRMVDALQSAIVASGFDVEDVSLVGIALPALVDSEHGVIHFMTTFPHTTFPFVEVVSQRLGLPVALENHISGMARAEHWFGRAKNLDTFTLIHIGPAIGAAQYFRGMPRTGAHGINPQVAHMKTGHGHDAPLCYCGARGCVTSYASTFGMAQQFGLVEGFRYSIPDLERSFAQLLERACSGDEKARAVIECGGAHLAMLVANMIVSQDPGEILIVAPDARYIEIVRERFETVLRKNVIPSMAALTKWRFEVSDEDWECKGTAALAMERLALQKG